MNCLRVSSIVEHIAQYGRAHEYIKVLSEEVKDSCVLCDRTFDCPKSHTFGAGQQQDNLNAIASHILSSIKRRDARTSK